MLEKGRVATMPRAHFTQKARHALAPMRKATTDALLLTAFILIGLLVFTGILFTSPWLILPIYALAYLLTVVLRLRQAARETTAAPSKELQASPIDYTAFTVAQGWRRETTRTPPEEY